MILFHVAGVGSLSNQLCNIFDIFTPSAHEELDKLLRVSELTPRKPPSSYHLLLTETSNVSNLCFSGFTSVK